MFIRIIGTGLIHASIFAGADVLSGTILAYGSTTVPAGYLLCDGSAVSRTTYSDLFAVIGTSYGSGNGTTTFNVPNTARRFPMGKSGSDAMGSSGGTFNHTHIVPTLSGITGGPLGTATASLLSEDEDVADAGHIHQVSTNQDVTGVSNPPYVVVVYIIKT